jgi:hypothetical protein
MLLSPGLSVSRVGARTTGPRPTQQPGAAGLRSCFREEQKSEVYRPIVPALSSLRSVDVGPGLTGVPQPRSADG